MKPVITATLLLLSIPVFAGIYRHDVPLEKYTALANQKEFDCVGKIIHNNSRRLLGSCVLINEKYVLTAAHVLLHYKAGERVVRDTSELSFVFNNHAAKAKRIVVHPRYLEYKSNDCDIAIIELEKPLKEVSTTIITETTDELSKEVVIVGYGALRKGNEISGEAQAGLKVAGKNIVDSIGGYVIRNNGTTLIADFDHPEIQDLSKMGDRVALPLEIISNGGDSGGGWFVEFDEKYALIGIVCSSKTTISTKTGYYGSVSHATRIATLCDWIKEEMDE